MFARWTQEKFFKYLRQDYEFDRLLQYAVEQIDKEFVVNNPKYNNITYKIGKLREKIARRKASLCELQEHHIKDDLDRSDKYQVKQSKVKEELEILETEEKELLDQRHMLPSQLKIKDMPDDIRYNKLNMESKRFLNIIKMICYRAETACANLLSSGYAKRALVKSIIKSHADILPDYQNNQLLIKIYTLK